MQNCDRGKSYRTLLLERQGKSFSEFEVTEILREVLPQLAELHVRGQARQAHGAVFLDNLVYDLADNRALLVGAIAPEKQQPGQASISKDIYSLGVAALALLTAKPLNLLRHPDGSWNWEEHCTVSDQLAAMPIPHKSCQQLTKIQRDFMYLRLRFHLIVTSRKNRNLNY
ncbi:MAG: hypothetical protein EA000_07615 [Oscillatoriales cyanobacterium]|nr:MAG: hypothetical protein EA000_07615 [Oscillatoriales cyanobacterium]